MSAPPLLTSDLADICTPLECFGVFRFQDAEKALEAIATGQHEVIDTAVHTKITHLELEALRRDSDKLNIMNDLTDRGDYIVRADETGTHIYWRDMTGEHEFIGGDLRAAIAEMESSNAPV